MVNTANSLKKRNLRAITGMLIGTTIYSIAIVWVLDLGEFYAGGITGISQLLSHIASLFDWTISKGILIALFNVPLFIIAWSQVSNRFAIFSLISVALQVVFIILLEFLVTKGINPLAGLANEKLLLAIIGGLMSGAGCGISLRSGASSGGMDILSQYVSLKKNVSFVKFSMSVDLVIIVMGGLVAQNINVAIFTIVRLLTHIITLDKIHTIYKFMKITIITTQKEAVRDALIKHFNHGITIFNVIGGYTNQPKWALESVVSSYETEEYSAIVKSVDPNVFITYTSIERIEGFFNRNVIA